MSSFTIWSLSEGSHLAWIGDDVVVLNVGQDRYSCLVEGASFIAPGDGPGSVSIRQDATDPLLAIGLIQAHADRPKRQMPLSPARCLSAPPRLSVGAFAGVSVNALAGERRFRAAAFQDVLEAAERYRRHARSTPQDDARARELTGQFFTVLPYLPGQGLCLHRCFMLLRYLARHGIACDWVFGVRTWPFAAHCWLMIDDAVLGDELDRVRAFTPILVV